MTPASKPLSDAEMKAVNDRALAAVQRGRETLARSHELRQQTGATAGQLKKAFDALPPYSRTWVNKAARIGIAQFSSPEPATAGAGRRRKPRQMV